jgi:hypothetical protein
MASNMASNNANPAPRFNKDGSSNKNYVDMLEEDKPIAGQKFACVSFVSPEQIIKNREMYNFQSFLKQWDMNKSLEKFNHFLSFLAYKYSLNFDNITKDLQEFCKDEKDKLFTTSLEDDFKNYMDINESLLEESFTKEHGFQTSVRGVKIRGSYPTQEEAEMRCKLLREVDPNHDVYVGPVGLWMPFHPESYKTGRVEYMEDELNELMHEKNKNENSAKVEFDKRVREAKVKAMEDNKKKALETGNLLTQTIDADGNLISVKDLDTETVTGTGSGFGRAGAEISVADLRKELFEGENIVTSKDNDHGLSRVAELRNVPT